MLSTTYKTILGLASTTALALAPIAVDGTLSGWGQLRNDDRIDLGLVLTPLSGADIMTFSFKSVFGPESDLRAGPVKVKVPGNLYVPRQRESYGVIPLTIEKEKFTLNFEPGIKQELYSLWIYGPFNDLAKKAQNKAPWSELVPLVSFNSYGFSLERDWTQSPQPTLATDVAFSTSTRLLWNKSAPGVNTHDMVITLQKTPATHWVFTDMTYDPLAVEGLNTAAPLTNQVKAITFRIETLGDATETPKSARGYITNGARGGRLEVTGIPPALTGLSVSGSAPQFKAQWTPITDRPGAMAIITNKRQAPSDERFALSEFPFFEGFARLREWISEISALGLVSWFDAATGEAMTTTDPAAVHHTFLFVGTDTQLELPSSSREAAAQFFEHATEFSLDRLM